VARLAPLLEQCRALLDRFTLSAPIIGVTVAITATAPATGEQGNILDPTWRDPAAVDAAFTRLRAELGAASVVRPVSGDDHRPEHAGAWADGAVTSSARRITPRLHASRLVHRLFAPPESVTAECVRGRPVAIHWRARRVALDLTHRPERLAGAWWSDAYARDYWRGISATTTLILFLDHTRDAQWYLQGWHD
jgi:hypothetical protein